MNTIHLALAIALGAPVLAHPQSVERAWEENYDDGNDPIPKDIATDDAGNIYVGGYAWINGDADYLLLKYSPDGTRLWERTFDETAELFGDWITDVATDSEGNVVVTGHTESYGLFYRDYVTVKYDTNGNEVWVARYHRNLHEEAREGFQEPRLAIDSQDDVYLVGSKNPYNGPTSHDLMLVKYVDPPVFNPALNRYEPTIAWEKTFNGASNAAEQPRAIAIDDEDNLYVTSSSVDFSSGSEYFLTLKYNESQVEPLWFSYYGGNVSWTMPSDVKADSSGSVYVTGNTWIDLATLKYDPANGDLLWESIYDQGGRERSWLLALDGQDDVLVGAVVEDTGTGYYDNTVIKYSAADGQVLWENSVYGTDYFDEDDHPYIAVDRAGNVYLQSSFYHEAEEDWDFQVSKLEGLTGSILWTDLFENVNGTWDAAAGAVLDPWDNLVVTGWVTTDPVLWNYTIQTLKYGNTQPGTEIEVSPDAGSSLTFAEITTPGETTVEYTSTAPPLPSGFQIPGGDPSYIDIETSATFTGPVTLAFAYDESQFTDEASIRILHYDEALQDWEDVTTHVDTVANIVYGETLSFSPFAIVEALDIAPPTADAGPDQSIRAGDTVFLDGSASFDNNTDSQALVYAWSFASLPAGSNAVLTGAQTATPSFVVDLADTYELELVVTDEAGLESAPDAVIVSSDNLAPTAAAGDDRLVLAHDLVVLDGSASADPENDALAYAWALVSAPAGSTATLQGAHDVTASFVPDREGLYTVSLVVSDSIGPGSPDTVEIAATNAATLAQHHIMEAAGVLSGVASQQITNKGNQTALVNFLSQATLAIQQADTAAAIDKLEKSIARTDGCPLRGTPDGNGPGRDWITDCAVQNELHFLLSQALTALQ